MSNWLMAEFERARKRSEQLPDWARPVIVRRHGQEEEAVRTQADPCPCADEIADPLSGTLWMMRVHHGLPVWQCGWCGEMRERTEEER